MDGESGYGKDQPNIPYAVVNDSLKGCCVGVRPPVSSANK